MQGMQCQPGKMTLSPLTRSVLRVVSPAANVVMLRQSARDPGSEPAKRKPCLCTEHAAGVCTHL